LKVAVRDRVRNNHLGNHRIYNQLLETQADATMREAITKIQKWMQVHKASLTKDETTFIKERSLAIPVGKIVYP
jgi:hypothetical protein